MNWQAITFDWNQVRAFLATAEEGSLSAAARALGLAQPTLGRQVAALEERLGVILFERVGRGVALTQAGRDLLDPVRAMGEAAHRIALVAAGRAESVAGKVCISVADVMAAYVLPGVLADLREAAPDIDIEILATNSLSDLLHREADIAIRHVRPEEPDLVARLVREGAGGIYAAQSFLRRHGRPRVPADLETLPFVGMASPERMAEELARIGLPVPPRNFVLTCENMAVACEMVRQGLGVGVMSDDIASHMPEVERLLPDLPPIPVPLWLVTHRELRTSRRIRVVFDHLAAALAR
ncbi:MAG: LysR family transcriptional regulator [Rhodobacter sp.]|nr:LysR family transcriptional regulator [Paracoccaceae bacterium]MCC0075369.1 LysR family transcriptional regulator [Rhodobacter sp.]